MKIISGGQDGVDQAALFAARIRKVPTGGTAPKGWRTDSGHAPWLADYGLVESHSDQYVPRTVQNVNDSDGTVWFGKPSPGYHVTRNAAIARGKPWLENPSDGEALAAWIRLHKIETLNVAGNRAQRNPAAAVTCACVLSSALYLVLQ